METQDMLMRDTAVSLGNGVFLDLAEWADGSVTVAVSSTNDIGEDVRFDATTIQAYMVRAALDRREE